MFHVHVQIYPRLFLSHDNYCDAQWAVLSFTKDVYRGITYTLWLRVVILCCTLSLHGRINKALNFTDAGQILHYELRLLHLALYVSCIHYKPQVRWFLCTRFLLLHKTDTIWRVSWSQHAMSHNPGPAKSVFSVNYLTCKLKTICFRLFLL